MGRIYGYGCVSSGKILRTDSEALKRTKAYTELLNTFKRLDLPEEDIHVDLVSGNYRKRKYLDYILEYGGHGDCIVIETISALGFSSVEIADNYKKLYKRNIGVYVADEFFNRMLRYSTAIRQMCIEKDLEYTGGAIPFMITQNLDQLQSAPVKSHKGRAFMQRPENFKRIYWLYENYFIAESDAYHNNLIDMGKKRFHRLAQEYEELDPAYEADLNEQDELYDISLKPKRRGVLPEHFDDLLENCQAGMDARSACEKAGCYYIPPIDIERYRLKLVGGRSAVALAGRYKDSPIAHQLREGVVKEKIKEV